MLDLACVNQFLYCSGHILDGNVRIDPMLIQQINGLNPQALERFLGDLFDALRAAIETAPSGTSVGIELKAELGGDNHLPPKGSQRFSYQFFVGKGSVNLSRIEKGDTMVHCLMEKRDHLCCISNRFICKGHAHAA